MDMLAADDGVAGVVELLSQKCRNCYRKKNPMVEDTEPYCLDLALQLHSCPNAFKVLFFRDF
jgi:hypothetical protein